MSNVDFQCYGKVTLIDPGQLITTCSASFFAWSNFDYVDLTEYGGDQYTPVSGSQDFIDAMEALGYSVFIQQCSIYFTDLLKPAKSDIVVKTDPLVELIKEGTQLCDGGAIPYADFDYIDLSFYGGGEVEVSDEPSLIQAFSALGITVTVEGCGIKLNGWGGDPIQDIQAYSHERVTITAKYSDTVCSGNAINFPTITCLDLSNYGGANAIEIASNQDILAALDPLVSDDIYMDECDVVFKFQKTAQQPILAYGHQVVNLVDTDENLGVICENGAVYWNKFDYIDLSDYGGQTSVRVESNQDIIDAFAAIGITASISGCDITIEECLSSYPDIEVSVAPTITLVDTDENITTCVASSFVWSNFDALDLSYYDVNNVYPNPEEVEIDNATELIAAFATMGWEIEVTGCTIKLLDFTGTPQDIEVCKYPTIVINDQNGNQLCDGGAIPYNQIVSIDMSAYGGAQAVQPIESATDIVAAFGDVGIEVQVNGCNIEFQECYLNAPDIAAMLVSPVVEADVAFTGGQNGIYTITLEAYLLDLQNNKLTLENGDKISVKIPSRSVDVELVVGGNPDTFGTGYVNDVGGKWATEIAGNLANVTTMSAASLLAGTYYLQFEKRNWAEQVNKVYQPSGPSAAMELTWDFRAIDVSTSNTSAVDSILMKKIVTLLDGFLASTHLNSGTTRIWGYGNPSFNPISSINHLIGGTSFPVSFFNRGFSNGIEYEEHQGSYTKAATVRQVLIEINRDNGWRSTSIGYLRNDADFLLRTPCAIGQTQYCTISAYGEHEEGTQPNTWSFAFQALEEYSFSSYNPVPPQEGKVIYDGVSQAVTFSQPAPGLWNSNNVLLTGLDLNVQHTLRCEARDTIYNNLAYIELDLEVVALY